MPQLRFYCGARLQLFRRTRDIKRAVARRRMPLAAISLYNRRKDIEYMLATRSAFYSSTRAFLWDWESKAGDMLKLRRASKRRHVEPAYKQGSVAKRLRAPEGW